MPLFKVSRHPALVGIAVVLFLYFSMAPREVAITYQGPEEDKESFNRYADKEGHTQYRAGERVASDIYVNCERALVPETEIISHVPGFTVIQSMLVANGTFFIVSDDPSRLPGLQFVLSAWNNANGERPSSSIPSQNEIRVISRKTVGQLMGPSASLVAGTTWIYNEPYVYGDGSWPLAFLRAHYMQDHGSTNNAILLPPKRLVFSQIHSEKIQHDPAFSSLPRLLFPGLGVLYTEDWKDYTDSRRPFLFEHVVLIDRGAAARQNSSGGVVQGGERIDNETEMLDLQFGTPFDSFRDIGGLWWNRWRDLLAENADLEANIGGSKTGKTVITLVQDHNGQRGRLSSDSDTKLRAELATMKLEEDYEINYVKWNETNFVDRLDLALRTTIFLGVAGSLTESMWMTVTPHSAVMEFFPDHYLSRRTQGIARAIGVHYTAWQGSKPYHFHTLELPSKSLGIQDNPHHTPHEHQTRDSIEPRDGDLIQLDSKAVANAIRRWVREHQPVDKSS